MVGDAGGKYSNIYMMYIKINMQNIQILIILEHWHLISIIINYDYNCINTMNYQQQTEILVYNIHIEKKIYE